MESEAFFAELFFTDGSKTLEVAIMDIIGFSGGSRNESHYR
ncbi:MULTISPECIES: hypothetical protein [Nitrosomonas]|nr:MULTISPECIES: hypothetical protein [Nitrosomonas]MBV6389897.1 hypothetical protein [Nitrosomonas europaea]SDW59091.1 hypothetical protein SAMN05216310_12342 [Nitrosomonas europaea]SET20046.1 hypothetical protein SAMN05216309_12441 [Nitrosomonas europaea]SJZ70629.1 hypothetical protein SAMN02745113_01668 [Nitrosomonas europaea]HNR11548.1 hypothetical protein [Nitrosomonas europaea]